MSGTLAGREERGARGARWEGLLKNRQANIGETCINIIIVFTSVTVLHGTLVSFEIYIEASVGGRSP